jgi:hypothetical protein
VQLEPAQQVFEFKSSSINLEVGAGGTSTSTLAICLSILHKDTIDATIVCQPQWAANALSALASPVTRAITLQ